MPALREQRGVNRLWQCTLLCDRMLSPRFECCMLHLLISIIVQVRPTVLCAIAFAHYTSQDHLPWPAKRCLRGFTVQNNIQRPCPHKKLRHSSCTLTRDRWLEPDSSVPYWASKNHRFAASVLVEQTLRNLGAASPPKALVGPAEVCSNQETSISIQLLRKLSFFILPHSHCDVRKANRCIHAEAATSAGRSV
jgi:hypothetical protein